jgi:hypothetical protein
VHSEKPPQVDALERRDQCQKRQHRPVGGSETWKSECQNREAMHVQAMGPNRSCSNIAHRDLGRCHPRYKSPRVTRSRRGHLASKLTKVHLEQNLGSYNMELVGFRPRGLRFSLEPSLARRICRSGMIHGSRLRRIAAHGALENGLPVPMARVARVAEGRRSTALCRSRGATMIDAWRHRIIL